MAKIIGGRWAKNWDWILLGVTVLLVAIGILVIYSISFKASQLVAPSKALAQIGFAVVGLIGLAAMALLDYRVWLRSANWLYLAGLGLLLLVLVNGHTALGATRWLRVGPIQFQPSEIAKLGLILLLARFLSKHYDEMDRWQYLLFALLYVAVPVGLVLLQPDLGTAIVFGVVGLAMILATKVRKLYVAGLAVATIAALPWIIKLLKPYQQQRLETFLNPTADPLGSGYNVVQATIAVGSGQLFGRGLGAGSQSQLNFLPSQHTDFIFAVLAEKLGLVGSLLLLALFAVLIWRGVVIAWRAGDRFGFLVAVGIVTLLLCHFLINIGMNVGIAPVTGIPLPLVSYGGTSLVITLLSIGLLEGIHRRRKKLEFSA